MSAGEAVGFALAFGLTPAMLQPHFVLFVGAAGQVRLALFALITDQPRPHAASPSELRLVRLLSEDLNGAAAGAGALTGVWMDFRVGRCDDETDMAQIIARSTGAFQRAADECLWDLVLDAG